MSNQSSRHCWRLPLPHASELIQRDFGCVLGVEQQATSTLPKVIWCGRWGCNLGQSLSIHGPHVLYRRKIRRASRPGKQFNLVIDEEPLENACHVWSRIILLKYGCGQALKQRVVYPWSVVAQAWTHTFWIGDRSGEQPGQGKASLHSVSNLESDHRDFAGRSGICHQTQCCSIPLSMSTVHYTIVSGNAHGLQPRVNEALYALRTFHSTANGVE
ncbi:uncharacterized protein TNCV_4122541 [Trichonephila clavipes]|nr:uncharacterized protein TNCV_4122541 [Trichonephila clavipes]